MDLGIESLRRTVRYWRIVFRDGSVVYFTPGGADSGARARDYCKVSRDRGLNRGVLV